MNAISKRELAAILNATYDGMIAVDAEGIVTLFNRAAEEITGLSADDVTGRPASECIPDTKLHTVLIGGEPGLNEQQYLGNKVVLTNRVPVKDEAGKIIGAVAVLRDITEVRAMTEKISDLWSARSLLEAVIASTEDAISVADENGNTIIVNQAYTRITGLPREAVINKPVTVDIAEGESMHMKVLRTGKPVKNVHMKVGPAGKDVIVNVAPIFIDGRIRGSAGVIHDISEITALNEELARVKKLIRHLEAHYTWDDIIGDSPAIERAKEQARRAAETPATVLLRGESGTGKELFAHAIHNASQRSSKPFIRVNCAALSETLLESELFGYEKGAFTGALRDGKKGLFEEADGGTIFLDEIGDISQSLQSKLLRVLQEKEIVRVGGTRPLPVNVRVIAATNADLREKIESGSFREDLFYRLNVIPIRIPPLREHMEDVGPIAEHFIFKLNQEYGREVERISDGALKRLTEYEWPGNVRELENVLAMAMVTMLPQEKVIEIRHLPPLPLDASGASIRSPASVRPLKEAVDEAERAAVEGALRESGGNRTRAAALLGVSMRSLFYKMRKHGIK
jgi:PAS domain S-box-containing protein